MWIFKTTESHPYFHDKSGNVSLIQIQPIQILRIIHIIKKQDIDVERVLSIIFLLHSTLLSKLFFR